MEPLPKRPLESRTVWLAVIVALLGAVNSSLEYVEDSRILSWLMVGQAALFLFLRFLTDRPIA